jgi:hypothetical protein
MLLGMNTCEKYRALVPVPRIKESETFSTSVKFVQEAQLVELVQQWSENHFVGRATTRLQLIITSLAKYM